MLRNAILVIATGLFVLALVAFAIQLGTVGLLVVAGLLLLGTVFERFGYGRAEPRPPIGGGWQETAERFVDPESGRLVAVWFDPATGQRRYVDAGVPPG